MHYLLTGNAINDDGTIGRRMALVIDHGTDAESGSRLTWAMEKQTKDISMPVVRAVDGVWSMAADSAQACARALGQ